ncbi:MAG: hypothetical protein NTX04_04350 [Verrucomicrobia bacterium]|nr:hypothetical protein [Verrucomicrobiota bacterium]
MKKILPLLLSLVTISSLAFAEIATPSPSKSTPASTPAPAKPLPKPPTTSTPPPASPSNPNVFQKIFGSRLNKSPVPPAAPPPTTPSQKPKPKRPTPEKDPEETTPPTDPSPTPAVPPKKGRKGKTPPVIATPTDIDPAALEQLRFNAAKTKAMTKPEIIELKAKADQAATEDDARNAQRTYTKALYREMRQIDETIEERVKAVESAVLKRLDSK